jgi:hypothetical protein
MKNATLEKLYPLTIAALVSYLTWYLNIPFPVHPKEFLAASLGFGAILTGFITTAKAILVSMPSDSLMGSLRKSGYVDDLILYLKHALYGCLLFSGVCLVGFFILTYDEKEYTWPMWYKIIWVASALFAGLSFQRVSKFLFSVIKYDPNRK